MSSREPLTVEIAGDADQATDQLCDFADRTSRSCALLTKILKMNTIQLDELERFVEEMSA